MDKAGLLQAWGGPTQGEVANHIIPDSMLANPLAEYDPYPTPGDAGDSRRRRRR